MSTQNIGPENCDFKSTGGQIAIDEADGIVECFAAGIGNKDSVGDVILPNAFEKSLKRRMPRVVWGHDWNHPIGKVLEVYEVGPNDPRLPPKMKAAGIGGLYARVKFNLKSEKGREAFANIIFFGEDQEWSIGYKTLDAIYDGKIQANMLKEVELYEMSPVLHGANQLTSTISIKSEDFNEDDDIIRKGLAKLKTFVDENPEWVQGFAADGEKRDFSADKRQDMANRGSAMSDGSFPIANAADLKNAIRLAGRAKNPSAARSHIRKRATALGLTSLLPDDWKSDSDYHSADDSLGEKTLAEAFFEEKVGLPGAEPNSGRGNIAGGRGPRRGNLEDLLDYWRPIMKKPGGFRRCLVILADHPELGPLPNMCAWLHHETTGKWPNEGHGKSAEFVDTNANLALGHVAQLAKSLSEQFGGVVMIHRADNDTVVYDLVTEDGGGTYKSSFSEKNDEFLFGKGVKVKPKTVYSPVDEEECDCAGDCCSTKKSENNSEILEKVGRAISINNLSKLQEAMKLLGEVIAAGGRAELQMKDEMVFEMVPPALKSAIDAVNSYHGSTLIGKTDGKIYVEVKSEKHRAALVKIVSAFSAQREGVES